MPRTSESRIPPANLPMRCRFAAKYEHQWIFVAQNDLCDLFLHCIAQQQLFTTSYCYCCFCGCCYVLHVVVSCVFTVCLVCCCCECSLVACLCACLSVSCVCSLIVYRILTILRIVALAIHTSRFNSNLSVLSIYLQLSPARKMRQPFNLEVLRKRLLW